MGKCCGNNKNSKVVEPGDPCNPPQPKCSDPKPAAKEQAIEAGSNPFSAVGLAYVSFALEKPAFFRAMWREEAIYSNDEDYVAAAAELAEHLHGGFAETIHDHDPHAFSPEELLAWSSVHGLANLFVDGPVAKGETVQARLTRATEMINVLERAFV